MAAGTPAYALNRDSKWAFTDLDGTRHQPFDDPMARAVVFVFIAPDCPVANYFQPTLRKLGTAYDAKGVRFVQIHPDPTVDKAKAKQHAKEFDIRTPIVMDPDHRWVARLKAEVTPEAFVVTREGRVAYRGRIDDTYATWGKKKRANITPDLGNALDAVISGKAPTVPRTGAVGCFIKDMK